MNMKRFLAIALSLCLLLSMVPMGAFAAEDKGLEVSDLMIEELDSNDYDVDLTKDSIESENVVESQTFADDESVKVIIVMEEASVVESDAAAVLNDETVEQTEQLQASQAEIVSEIEQTVLDGEPLDVNYNYTWLLNGISAQVPYGTISAISEVDGVEKVLLQRSYQVCENEVTASDILTNNDGVMIGRESTWAEGYTGEGMTIAIIDTGLDIDHQNFQALDESVETSVSADDVSAVLGNLNASSLYSGLTLENVYYSSKVVFGFNYSDNNINITHDYDSQSDHGTHVAGIAAANKVEGSEAVGVAPDAQLMVMKVFGENGGAYDDDILAALEDAMMLGADVINLSLGSPAGFTTSEWVDMAVFYDRVAETDTVLTISAGNNYDAGYANNWGTNANQTINPDNAVVGSPGTYANVLSVASVENVAYLANYIDVDGYRIGYLDSAANYGHADLISLTDEYQVVAVTGAGDVADYEGLDVTGKVALVQRGSINFSAKCDNAAAAGAVACIVYNNTSGDFGMDLSGGTSTIPCVSITMSNGSYLLSALAENPELTVSFPEEEAEVANENAYDMSDFSSWGPAPDLSLEPDITAPGGNIYSTLTNGEYGIMSGTSMAAPNLAGISALLMQYVKDNFDETTDYRSLVRDLLMSTSVPLVDDETGLTYSPRKQGSGLANAYSAVATQAYLTVDGSDTAKAELGDDDNRTGIFNYTFDVHNFGETDLFYALNTTAQTEDVISYGNGGDGYDFMSGTPIALSASVSNGSEAMVLTHDVDEDGVTGSHDAYWIYQTVQGQPLDENWNEVAFRYDTDCSDGVDTADVQAYLDALVGNDSAADLENTVLKVEAGQTAAVDVNVTLSAEDKAYFDFYYTNGGYVEGYTYLTAKNSGSVDLSLPYLGFYGDWGEAPVLDEEVYFWDTLNEGAVGSQYFHALLTEYGNMGEYYMGYNLYVEDTVDPAHISVSPDGNGYVDDVSNIYVSMMRNAAEMTVSYTDANSGEVYYEHTIQNAPKSCYSSSNGMVIPFVYSWYADEMLYDMTDLPNNTELVLTVEVVGVAENDEPEILSFPITVDLEAPTLTGAKKLLNLETGERTLELTFSENVSAAAVGLLSADGNELFYLQGVEDVAEDENGYQNYTVTFDVTNISDKVMLVLADYALNEAYYGLNLNGEGASYGDLVAYQYNFNTGTNAWVSFDANVNADETALFLGETDIICAEYVNGFVFAQTEDGKLYGFPYEDMLNDSLDLESTYVAQLDNVYQDLAYSYAEGKLYGLFVYEDDGYPTSELYSININGEYHDDNLWATVAPYQEDWVVSRGGLYGLTMAIDDAGTVYVLGHNYTNSYDENDEPVVNVSETAHLWSVGLEYDEWSESYMMGYLMTDLGDVGMSMDYLQSMTWDHNAEKLYWARFNAEGLDLVSELVEIDPVSVSATKVGTLSGETCALFAPLSEASAAKEAHAKVPAMDTSVIGTPILRDSTLTMNVTAVKALSYDMDPWYTEHKSVVWSSSDENVAAVDANGYVTAVGTGSATITVANAEDETLFDTCTVEVTALDLVIEGVVTAQSAGIGNATGTSTYKFEMVDGLSQFGTVNAITAPEELNFGLDLATSVMGRGSIWASEYGNTGMIYQINAESGEVQDVLQPIDGDMLFGMTYNEELDTFAGIMNMYLYVDLALTHEEEEAILGSYDEELNAFMYHKVDMLPYLEESNTGFVTGETGQGASSEIVFSGITTLPGGYYFEDTYKDYLGNWDNSGNTVTYTADQTLLLMDNVGRLWYIDEVTGMTKTSEDDYGNVEYSNADGSDYITCYGGFRNGVFAVETGDGVYSLFNIRCIDETDLTDMFHDGNMPRITYHFSDIKYAGETADGAPMIIMSLYDYWNEGTTNELYLYIPGVGTGEWVMDYDTWISYEVKTPTRLYKLGDTGEYNIIASVHSAEVTGGIDLVSSEEELAEQTMEELGIKALVSGAYSKNK